MSSPLPPEGWRSEGEVLARIMEHFPTDRYAVMPQVNRSTGFSRTARWCDALVMGLWPSRGLEIFGIEIKVSRSDWLRELKQPEKVEQGIYPFCDRWYVAVPEKDMVLDGELPPTWGLMVRRGTKLIVSHEAPKLEPKPLDRPVLAAILRAAQKSAPDIQVREDLIKARQELEYFRSEEKRQTNRSLEALESLRARVHEFEKASGVNLDSYQTGRIGNAVRAVLDGSARSRVRDTIRYLQDFRKACGSIFATVGELEEVEQHLLQVAAGGVVSGEAP